MNSLSRVATKEQSELHICTLDDQHTRDSLSALLDVFHSCYGPHGKVQMLHNDIGGPVSLTRASGRLLQQLSVRNALGRVVTTSVQSHLQQQSDGGLFSGLLCLLLVENSLQLEVHRRLLCDIYELFLNESGQCLKSSTNKTSANADFTSIRIPLRHIETVMRGKFTSSVLRSTDIDHVAKLVLKTFLEANFPSKLCGSIEYVNLEGPPVTDSKLLNGFLFHMPSIPVYTKAPINLKKDAFGSVAVALLSTSMSGDSQELSDATYEVSCMSDIPNAVVDQLSRFLDSLIRMGVGLVVCQKVIHPRLKRRLRESGVYFLERLGLSRVDALQKLTGIRFGLLFG